MALFRNGSGAGATRRDSPTPSCPRRAQEPRAQIPEGNIARTEERYKAALTEVDRLVARFRAIDPDLRRIVLFGSLAHGVPRKPDFDIDLSLEGVEYYGASPKRSTAGSR